MPAVDRELAASTLVDSDNRLHRAVMILRHPELSATQKVTDALAVLDPQLSAKERLRRVATDLISRDSASPEERAMGHFLRDVANDFLPGEELIGRLLTLVVRLEALR